MKKTVCITGGSGGIGQSLLKYLSDIFYVKALFRKESAISKEWEKQGCKIILGDLSNEESIRDLVAETEFVFHCAALINSSSLKEANEVNVEGTRRLAEAAAIFGCKRFIYLSSIAAYSGTTTKNKIYTEELEVNENPEMDIYSLTKLRSEIILKEVAKKSNLEYVILRPTFVYGPATKSHTLTPIEMIQKGLPVVFGNGEGILDIVYVEDVARAMVLAAHAPKANGEIFNLGGEKIKCQDYYSYYGRMLKRPVRHLPKIIANILLSLIKINSESEKSLKFLFTLLESSPEYPSNKAKDLLDYTPQFSQSVGMLKTELWLQANYSIPAKRHLFRNQFFLYNFYPAIVVHPESEVEIIQVIQEAAKANLKVRTIGSLHSFAPIPATEGICIVLDKYKNLIKIEGYLVTVQAGMKLCELNEILAKHNLALPTLGAIDEQTVSGAIATGTHGASLHYKNLSGYVQALRIVRADGSVLQVERSQDIFNAIAISMGLLGITSTITFECVPSFYLQSQKSSLPISDVIKKFDLLHQENKYVEMKYTPITDNVEILSINPTETTVRENQGWHPAAKTEIDQWFLTLAVKGMLRFFQFSKWNWLQLWVMKQYEGASHTYPSGRSDFVLTHLERMNTSPYPIHNMEIAIPYSQATAALTVLRNHFQTTRNYPNMYIKIRCSAADSFWLSPAYQRDVCWFDCWEYPYSGEFFLKVVELLMPFNFCYHWGKEIPVMQEHIKHKYDKWKDFAQLREEWDHNEMFLNTDLETLFPPNRK